MCTRRIRTFSLACSANLAVRDPTGSRLFGVWRFGRRPIVLADAAPALVDFTDPGGSKAPIRFCRDTPRLSSFGAAIPNPGQCGRRCRFFEKSLTAEQSFPAQQINSWFSARLIPPCTQAVRAQRNGAAAGNLGASRWEYLASCRDVCNSFAVFCECALERTQGFWPKTRCAPRLRKRLPHTCQLIFNYTFSAFHR